MHAELSRWSFLFGIPGIALQIGGIVMMQSTANHVNVALGVLTLMFGTFILLAGLAYCAQTKGRHPAWCLMALFSIVGVLVMACIKDRSLPPA